MTLLRSLHRFLRTRSFATLMVIVGGTLIRYGTVARHNQLIATHRTVAYGGLAIVIVGFILLRIAVSRNRRRKRMSPSVGPPLTDEQRQAAAAMGFDMQQKQQQAIARQQAAQQRSWDGR